MQSWITCVLFRPFNISCIQLQAFQRGRKSVLFLCQMFIMHLFYIFVRNLILWCRVELHVFCLGLLSYHVYSFKLLREVVSLFYCVKCSLCMCFTFFHSHCSVQLSMSNMKKPHRNEIINEEEGLTDCQREAGTDRCKETDWNSQKHTFWNFFKHSLM